MKVLLRGGFLLNRSNQKSRKQTIELLQNIYVPIGEGSVRDGKITRKYNFKFT